MYKKGCCKKIFFLAPRADSLELPAKKYSGANKGGGKDVSSKRKAHLQTLGVRSVPDGEI